jgi:hypothetical protein
MGQGSIPVNHAPSLRNERDLEDVKEEFSDASSNKSTIINNEENEKLEIKAAKKQLSTLKMKRTVRQVEPSILDQYEHSKSTLDDIYAKSDLS